MEKVINWKDGNGTITVPFDGNGNGAIAVSSTPNNTGADRSQLIIIETTYPVVIKKLY